MIGIIFVFLFGFLGWMNFFILVLDIVLWLVLKNKTINWLTPWHKLMKKYSKRLCNQLVRVIVAKRPLCVSVFIPN